MCIRDRGYNAGLVLADALKRAGDGADGTKLAAAIAATKDLPVDVYKRQAIY